MAIRNNEPEVVADDSALTDDGLAQLLSDLRVREARMKLRAGLYDTPDVIEKTAEILEQELSEEEG